MLTALLSAFVLLAAANNDILGIYDHGVFENQQVIETRFKDDAMYFSFVTGKCIEKFIVMTSAETNAVVQTIRGHDENGYKWVDVGEASLTETQRTITLNEAPFCGSKFRIVVDAGVTFTVVLAEVSQQEETREKRATTCAGRAGTWPTQCNRASDGAYCLASGFCGCLQDADCYSSTVNPYCNVGTQACNYCTNSDAGLTQQHYFCRGRIPGLYAADPDLATRPAAAQVPVSENVPLFAEVCNGNTVDQTIGACERCDQANSGNVPQGINFPTFPGVTPVQEEFLLGNFFCRTIRGATSPTPSRPICISAAQFLDVGMGTPFTTFTLDMEIAWAGKGTGTQDSPAIRNKVVTRTLENWEGACGPCVLNNGGTPVRFHSGCSRTDARTPICDALATVGCRACTSNADCGLSSGANCNTDGTGSCTGGANCQADGSCRTCLSDLDCGTGKDGGEKINQQTCDVATGLCVDPLLCTDNFGGNTGAQPCPTSALPNCNKNGQCIRCTSNADCGSTDGPATPDQQVCDVANGVCTFCDINADCTGTTGANCQKSGACVDCTVGNICGNPDGGGITGGCSRSPNGYCADEDDQPICNTQSRRCESQCRGNAYCGDKGQAQIGAGITFNNGANCNSDGTCANCQTPGGAEVLNSPNCGNQDGPPAIPNAVGNPGQTTCSTTGICTDPFTCTRNSDCSNAPGAPFSCSAAGSSCSNCQQGGSCQACVVTYTTSTCGSGPGLDGGEQAGQVNCQQSTRQCVDDCDNNNDCIGTQGANCMDNGVCFDCRTDADCQVGNAWGGDNNGETLCNTGTRLCFRACNSNNDCSAPTPNCMKDGRCMACGSSLDCPNNDGPPGQASSAINTVCRSDGLCVDPFRCDPSNTPSDNNGCRTNGQGNNCMADRSCKTCTSNADCIQDGGFKPNQPKCDIASGVCVDCGSNNDCDATGKILNCNDDGRCSACTSFGAGTTCANFDGPPDTNHINQNCDPISQLCVDFCTADDQCTDSCAPRCAIERGCCVECTSNSHCPVPQWRGSQLSFTECSEDFMCVLPRVVTNCESDADCSTSGLRACSFTQGKCVNCLYDSHCGGGTPACDTGLQVCVDCVYDHHCANILDEDGEQTTCSSDQRCVSGAGLLTASLFVALALAFAHLF